MATPHAFCEQGPGRYTQTSGIGPQCESDKANGAAVGFAKARRKGEARRFISSQHSRHHKHVQRNEPGPGSCLFWRLCAFKPTNRAAVCSCSGQYDITTSALVAEKAAPAVSFGSETRDQRRLKFVSHSHTAIDYQGRFSPGPAKYGAVRHRQRSPALLCCCRRRCVTSRGCRPGVMFRHIIEAACSVESRRQASWCLTRWSSE